MAAINCPKCQKEIDDNARFCRFCGTPLKQGVNNFSEIDKNNQNLNVKKDDPNKKKYIIVVIVVTLLALLYIVSAVLFAKFAFNKLDDLKESYQESYDESNDYSEESDDTYDEPDNLLSASSYDVTIPYAENEGRVLVYVDDEYIDDYTVDIVAYNEDVVDPNWGDWDGNTIPLYLDVIGKGTTNVSVKLDETGDIIVIKVTVV